MKMTQAEAFRGLDERSTKKPWLLRQWLCFNGYTPEEAKSTLLVWQQQRMIDPYQLACLIDRVREIGKPYVPAIFPDGLERGDVGHCFDASIMVAAKSREEYIYVEGVARVRGRESWSLHAWVTDGVHAFDPTWYALFGKEIVPVDGEYIGIEMDAKLVFEFMKKTKRQGVLANGWRAPDLFKSAVPNFGDPIKLCA